MVGRAGVARGPDGRSTHLALTRRAGPFTNPGPVLTLTRAEMPAALAKIPSPPEVLYVQGRLESVRRVALVGARAVPPRSAQWAREAAQLLARSGIEVVSGGARGTDTAAHLGALDAGGTTTVVLAGGLDRAYPRENRALFDTIAAGRGAVVTEHPLGTEPLKQQFPSRNRIVSGLCEATVIVHAAHGSGSLHTARAAIAQERRLFAVPGAGEGADALLAAGKAEPVLTPAALCAALGASPTKAPAPRLSGNEEKVFALLDAGPRHLDDLASRSRLAPGALFLALGRLETDNLVQAQPGNFYRRR